MGILAKKVRWRKDEFAAKIGGAVRVF